MLESVGSYTDGYQIIIAGAPGIDRDFYKRYTASNPDVVVLFDQTYRILAQSDAALVTSGTATLEAAILDVPQVVCYRMSAPKLSSWAFRNILHTPYISLVNLICNQEVVKEYFAESFTVENVRRELGQMLHVQKYRQNMLNNYKEMREILGESGASGRAAKIIYSKTT